MTDTAQGNQQYQDIEAICRVSQKPFVITAEDQVMLERFDAPLPTLCPAMRLRRRLTHRNNHYVFLRKCSHTGAEMFSAYPPETPYPVVNKDYWWSDEFDAKVYARDFDFNRSCFLQIHELSLQVPKLAISAYNLENSDFCNNANGLRNCYLVFNTGYAEDCMYGIHIWYAKDCLECSYCNHSELCYDCVMCPHSYNLQSSLNCKQCSDSYFLSNCSACKHCFACSNLHRKEYCIFNEQKTKAEYEAYLAKLNLSSYTERSRIANDVWKFWKQFPQPHLHAQSVENVTGDNLFESKDISHSFFISNAENIRHSYNLVRAKDCMDHSVFGDNAELIYEGMIIGGEAYHIKFSANCWKSISNLEYCLYCVQSQDCFACVGLKNAKYCILNKQYDKESYEQMKASIIQYMKQIGEYGEFFPMWMSPFPYNLSLAAEYFPMSQSQAAQHNLSWYDAPTMQAAQVIDAHELPDGIPNTDESLTVKSARSEKIFRIIPRELAFYRKFNAPLPRMTYDERISERACRINTMELHTRHCAKTGKEIQTSYPPESDWIVWDKEEWDREYRG